MEDSNNRPGAGASLVDRPIRPDVAEAEPALVPARAATGKGCERAAQILECAKDILVESGFGGLSYRSIAKKAGITIGNVTYYYPSKDGLMIDLAEYIFDRWERRLRRQVSSQSLTSSGVFRYAVRYMIEENKREKSYSLLMDMWAMANHNVSVAAMMTKFYERMQDHIARMLAEVNPLLTEPQTRLRAALITTQIEGLMVLLTPGRPPSRTPAGLEDAAIEQIMLVAQAP